MFDFGWAELLLIAAIALFVIGPQDIPKIAYQVGKFFRRIKYMQYALTGQFDDFMKTIEEKEQKQGAEPKQELDHDPYDEGAADAAYVEMMPLPDNNPAPTDAKTPDDDIIKTEDNHHHSSEVEPKQ